KPLLVRDFLRKLEREDEIVRRAVVPALERRGRRHSVESRIHFDGAECARVHREKINRPRIHGKKWTYPGVVVPSLGTDVNSWFFLGRRDWQFGFLLSQNWSQNCPLGGHR